MSSMGWLRWESVAEQTWLKREAETQWSGLKRFGKLLYLKKKKKGCGGAGLKRVNQGLRITLRRLNSSAHAEAKHAKKTKKQNQPRWPHLYDSGCFSYVCINGVLSHCIMAALCTVVRRG